MNFECRLYCLSLTYLNALYVNLHQSNDNRIKDVFEINPPFAKIPITNPDGLAKNKTIKMYNLPNHLCIPVLRNFLLNWVKPASNEKILVKT